MDYLPFLMLLALPASIWGFIFWKFKIWKKIMDVFKEGVTFEVALAEMKKGKSIRRKGSSYGFTKITVSALGENKNKFCEYDIANSDRLRENPRLSMEDIISSDWIIEGNKG